jgi:hypothetical protein
MDLEDLKPDPLNFTALALLRKPPQMGEEITRYRIVMAFRGRNPEGFG